LKIQELHVRQGTLLYDGFLSVIKYMSVRLYLAPETKSTATLVKQMFF